MNKIPQWALWGVVGAAGGILAGYILYIMTDPPTYMSGLDYWLDHNNPLLWIVLGAVLGALLSFLLTSKKPPSTPG